MLRTLDTMKTAPRTGTQAQAGRRLVATGTASSRLIGEGDLPEAVGVSVDETLFGNVLAAEKWDRICRLGAIPDAQTASCAVKTVFLIDSGF